MEQEEEDRARRLLLPIVILPLTGQVKSGSPLQSVKCIPKELACVRGQEGEHLADRGSTKGSMLPLLVMKPCGGTSAEQKLTCTPRPGPSDSGTPLVRGTRLRSLATMVY